METTLTPARVDPGLRDSPSRPFDGSRGMSAFLELRRQAAENGVSGMSLDEINAEISAARAERRERGRAGYAVLCGH